jgi:uncharacterized membrane protein
MSDSSENYSKKFSYLSFLSLFTSAGTLLCCALPALLVTLGAGATLAGITTNFPWLVAVSKYKIWVFIIAGILIILAFIANKYSQKLPCPADKDKAKNCLKLRKYSSFTVYLALLLYIVGFFFAFIAVHIYY